MRAIQIKQFGGPEVLEMTELPVPRPADGQLLVKVRRAGINFADMGARENAYLSPQELPLVPGLEIAGTVVEGSDGFEPDQRVLAAVPNGGYAEYALAYPQATVPIPDQLDDDTAVALLVQGVTAWHLCHSCAAVEPGQGVAIGAAAGGVGTLAIQLAKACGAHPVIALAGSEAKRRLCVELGADAAVDSRSENLKSDLLDATGGLPVDVVFEMAGGKTFDQLLDSLAPFGRLVTYGVASGEVNQVTTSDLIGRGRAVIGFWLSLCAGDPERFDKPLEDLFTRADCGDLKVSIGERYSLDQASQAHADLASRATTGKLVLDPAA